MDAKEIDELLSRNVEARGKIWHLIKAAEECNELSGAIMKHLTKKSSEEDIQMEMGDVEIALLNLSKIYGREIVEKGKKEKFRKIKKALGIKV